MVRFETDYLHVSASPANCHFGSTLSPYEVLCECDSECNADLWKVVEWSHVQHLCHVPLSTTIWSEEVDSDVAGVARVVHLCSFLLTLYHTLCLVGVI